MYQVLRIKYLIVFALLGILNTCFLLHNTAYAEGTSLQIQPSNLQIRAQSPSDVRAPFTLTNQSDDPVTLQIIVKRIRDAGDGTGKVIYSNPKLINEVSTDSFLKDVQVIDESVAITELTLGPKQKKNLVLRVNLLQAPPAKSARDHYFSLVFLNNNSETPLTNDEKDTTLSEVQIGISLPTLLSFNQVSTRTTFLDEFSGPLILESGPVPFTVRVKNTGEHFVQVHGAILIKNMFGQTVGKVDLPKTNVLSGSMRAITADALEQNVHTSRNLTDKVMWSEKFLLGVYTATITIASSPDQSLYTRSINFFAFPLIGVVIFILILLVGAFLIRRVRKKLSQ